MVCNKTPDECLSSIRSACALSSSYDHHSASSRTLKHSISTNASMPPERVPSALYHNVITSSMTIQTRNTIKKFIKHPPSSPHNPHGTPRTFHSFLHQPSDLPPLRPLRPDAIGARTDVHLNDAAVGWLHEHCGRVFGPETALFVEIDDDPACD